MSKRKRLSLSHTRFFRQAIGNNDHHRMMSDFHIVLFRGIVILPGFVRIELFLQRENTSVKSGSEVRLTIRTAVAAWTNLTLRVPPLLHVCFFTG